MGFQPFPGALFDQQVDERQPARLVDRLGQQGPIAVIVEALILLTHLTPPRTLPTTVFISPWLGAIVLCEHASRAALPGRHRRKWQAESDYLDCPVFGRAASWARAAIHASYSGVPRRGGTPGGMPPIHCGMSARLSPAVFPAQDVSMTPARQSKAQ